jgi:hypothetical protein
VVVDSISATQVVVVDGVVWDGVVVAGWVVAWVVLAHFPNSNIKHRR